MSYKASNAAAGTGGLLGAALSAADKSANASRIREAQERIRPLSEKLGDFDFRTEFWGALKETLPQSSWLSVGKFETLPNPGNPITSHLELQSVAHADLTTHHQLSEDSQLLVAVTQVRFFPANAQAPAYHGYLTYYSDPVPGSDGQAIKIWSADMGEPYKVAARQAIAEMMKMLRMDFLEKAESSEGGVTTSMRFRDLMGHSLTISGKVLARDGERSIIRHENGNLFSLPSSLPNRPVRPPEPADQEP